MTPQWDRCVPSNQPPSIRRHTCIHKWGSLVVVMVVVVIVVVGGGGGGCVGGSVGC